MEKIKNVYYDESLLGGYATGLVLELENGVFLRQNSTDVIQPFSAIKPSLTPVNNE